MECIIKLDPQRNNNEQGVHRQFICNKLQINDLMQEFSVWNAHIFSKYLLIILSLIYARSVIDQPVPTLSIQRNNKEHDKKLA